MIQVSAVNGAWIAHFFQTPLQNFVTELVFRDMKIQKATHTPRRGQVNFCQYFCLAQIFIEFSSVGNYTTDRQFLDSFCFLSFLRQSHARCSTAFLKFLLRSSTTRKIEWHELFITQYLSLHGLLLKRLAIHDAPPPRSIQQLLEIPPQRRALYQQFLQAFSFGSTPYSPLLKTSRWTSTRICTYKLRSKCTKSVCGGFYPISTYLRVCCSGVIKQINH